MTSSRRLAFAALVSMVGIACATATAPSTGGGTGSGNNNDNDDSGSPFATYGDGGGRQTDDSGYTSPPKKDAGTIAPTDSGTPTPKDSGTPPTVSMCSGETSSHKVPQTGGNKDYDIWCDYVSFYGAEFDCTQNSDCSGNYISSDEPECCYKPASGGYCEGDFGGKAQCVPQ
ncbi:MAG: hypothetical protein ABI461_07165 [Polyangiaceae bacterium]